MIEFVVLIIMIVIFAFLISTIVSSVASLLINVTILLLIAMQASKDIRKDKMQVYYLISIIITSGLFVFHARLWIFKFLARSLIMDFVQAILLIFAVAHVLRLLHGVYIDAKKSLKSRRPYTH